MTKSVRGISAPHSAPSSKYAVLRSGRSGDTNLCRMTGVTLHSHVHCKETEARTSSGPLFCSVKPYSHTMTIRVSSSQKWPPSKVAVLRSGCSQKSTHAGTSLIRNRPTLGPCRRPMPMAFWWSLGGGRFLMNGLRYRVTVTLYGTGYGPSGDLRVISSGHL